MLTREDKEHIVQELAIELRAKKDGSGQNLLVETCPKCGHRNYKYGIYIGQDRGRKKTFMSHCFSCGHSTNSLAELLHLIGRPDLMPSEIADFTNTDDFSFMIEEEIDDKLDVITLPEGYKRTLRNPYLKKRGFIEDDYDLFPVGTTRGTNFKYDDYVIFPIIDNGDAVGYVGRHIWSKDEIDSYNEQAKLKGKFQIRRYNNSTENNFVKLLYNYDSVIEDETDTVILCEGVFDVIALTRKLNLYDQHRIIPVATFGKKISDIQIYKLQKKGVTTIIIGYDSDASHAISKTATQLADYFDVLIAKIDADGKDWDEMDFWDIYDTFSDNLLTPTEYNLHSIT